MYAGNFSNISPYYWMGAYPSSELPMIFGTYGDFRSNGTEFQRDTSEAMQDFYLEFAKGPENGPSNRCWPKCSAGSVEVFGGTSGGQEITYQPVPKRRSIVSVRIVLSLKMVGYEIRLFISHLEVFISFGSKCFC